MPQLAVRQAETAPGSAGRLKRCLPRSTRLSQFFIAYQPDAALLWRVAERGMVAAQESEDPHTIGDGRVARRRRRTATAGAAHFDAADAVDSGDPAPTSSRSCRTRRTMSSPSRALCTFEAGYTAARRADTGTAWGYWDTARAMAEAAPGGLLPSRDVVLPGHHGRARGHGRGGATRRAGESVRQAAAADAATIRSRPRRARHRIEEARGYQLDGQPDIALATLEKAHEAAPETIKYNGYAKRIVLEEAESKDPARRRRASQLAVRIGLLAA